MLLAIAAARGELAGLSVRGGARGRGDLRRRRPVHAAVARRAARLVVARGHPRRHDAAVRRRARAGARPGRAPGPARLARARARVRRGRRAVRRRRRGNAAAAALVLLAAFGYAVATHLIRRLGNVSPLAVSAAALAIAAVLLAPGAAPPCRRATTAALRGDRRARRVCTAAAFALYYLLIAPPGATRAALTTYLAPVCRRDGCGGTSELIAPTAILGLALILVRLGLAQLTAVSSPAGVPRLTARRRRANRWAAPLRAGGSRTSARPSQTGGSTDRDRPSRGAANQRQQCDLEPRRARHARDDGTRADPGADVHAGGPDRRRAARHAHARRAPARGKRPGGPRAHHAPLLPGRDARGHHPRDRGAHRRGRSSRS